MDRPQKYAHIHGWGVDLDPAQRPAYPKERQPPRLLDAPRDPPRQQEARVEVLHSIERPGLTPVFGSSTPPSGLSGRLRGYAYRFSENDLRHWLMLLAADRLDVGESLLGELSQGRVPNLYAEMGGRAELKYNPAGAARKLLTLAALLGAGYWLWRGRRRPLRRGRS